MTLKRQLLVASLLMLLIPWAGLQFVLELDDALRQQAYQQLQEQAEQLAVSVGDELVGQIPIAADTPAIYAEPIDREIHLDGYADDWPGYEEGKSFPNWQVPGQPAPAGQPAIRWQAASNGRHLYLLIHLSNRIPVFFNPGEENQPYDHLLLFLQPPAQGVDVAAMQQSWLIRTPAPGRLHGLDTQNEQKPDYRIIASWESAGTGWQLELEMPVPPAGSRLGFSAHWTEDGKAHSVGTSLKPLPILVSRNRLLERQLKPRLNSGQRIQILEPGGWITTRQQVPSGEPPPGFETLSPLQVIEQISLNTLRALVRFYQPKPAAMSTGEHWADIDALPSVNLVKHKDDSVWLMTIQPVFGGRLLILEQSLDQLLTLSGSTLGSVIARSTLIIIGLTLVLLGYASWLSWRITRLQRAVSTSIDEDGRITGALPESRARDELGQLQRHFSQMVDRLHGYNHYLESFSRRLSH
ncbi:MAG TPA: histidine kinase, partial [Marinobacter sp.]|nr:histidine kinase [Marinobacter sp.]